MIRLTLSFFIFLSTSNLWAKIIYHEKSQDYELVVRELISGLQIPWGFEFLDDKNLLVSEKNGVISNFNIKTKKLTPLTITIPVTERGQGGLLDLKRHPQYPKTDWVYLTYVEEIQKELTTVLARFKLQKKNNHSFEKLLVTKARSSTSRHFGSRIAFDQNGYIYFSVGDRGERPNGQNLKTHAGSILRLHDDGRVPKNNPFVGHKNALPEIWSYGHRNAQGLVYDFTKNTLWAIEHGPRGGDEINLIEKGNNYGWPVISYGKEYSSEQAVGIGTKQKGVQQPIHYYSPSIAPCGMDIYRASRFKKWDGNLLSGALKLTHLNRVILKDNKFVSEERLLTKLEQRIRQVKTGPDGYVYFSTDSGKILRLEPN